MELLKSDKITRLVRKDWRTNNPTTLIAAMVNLFMATKVKRDYWLTDREYLFFICCVLIVNENVPSYLSGKSRKIYEDVMNVTRTSDITGLLNRLKKKGWLDYNTKTKKIIIPSFFTDIDLQSHDVSVNVEINYQLNETV